VVLSGLRLEPVFCRLLAREEEKGFCDVVVADLVDAKAGYPQHRNSRDRT
jgi:hypothetical protein